MTSHYLPADQWRALVRALLKARGDHDPENAIKIVLGEIGNIWPLSCYTGEDAGPSIMVTAG